MDDDQSHDDTSRQPDEVEPEGLTVYQQLEWLQGHCQRLHEENVRLREENVRLREDRLRHQALQAQRFEADVARRVLHELRRLDFADQILWSHTLSPYTASEPVPVDGAFHAQGSAITYGNTVCF